MRIIYLDLDSMRPDHFGCYGYHRNTTPNMDRIGRDGIRFTRAYCQSSPCVPSRANFMSGRYGIRHGALTHWGPGSQFRFPGEGHRYDPEMPLFTRHLRGRGYKTVSFSSFADRHQAHWYYAGWSEMHTHTLKGGRETADEVNEAVIPWLRAHGREDNYFLHIQYWDAHRPYFVDDRWIEMFRDEPPPSWPDEEAIRGHQTLFGPRRATALHNRATSPVSTMPDNVRNWDDWLQLVNAFDGAIRYMDDRIGRLFDVLDELGILDEMAIIITADHGEALGEEAIYADHCSASEAVHRIPMIVRWPGAPKNQTMDGFLYNLDLNPTLCELLDIPVPSGWDGLSFASAVRGKAWSGRSHLILEHGLYCCQRAVRSDEWLYVETYHPGLYDFRPVQLFNVREDPYQCFDLAASRPDVTALEAERLSRWRLEATGRQDLAYDPMEEIVQAGPWLYVTLEGWLERLRAEGREGEIEALRSRLQMYQNASIRKGG